MAANFYSSQQPEAVRTEESIVWDVTTTYVWRAAPGSSVLDNVWQIQKVVSDVTAGTTTVTFAEGSALYKFQWDDRATYSYS